MCYDFFTFSKTTVETRAYGSNLWSSTKVMGTDIDAAMDTGFQRLFSYISGENEVLHLLLLLNLLFKIHVSGTSV
jgi:hypothetical protein